MCLWSQMREGVNFLNRVMKGKHSKSTLIKLISFRFARRAIVVVAEWRSRDSPEIEGADILSRLRIADFLQHSLQFPTQGQFGTADVAPHVRGSANAIYDLCCQRLA